MSLTKIREELAGLADERVARSSLRFFKTGPGQYGEGDRFRGIRVPALRGLAKKYQETSLPDAARLLGSPFHEDRLLALLILVRLYAKGDEAERSEVYDLYLKSTGFINNWDLVDASAEHVVGAHLWERERAPLYRLAASGSLWERRISVVATFHFIRRREYAETLRLARLLLSDAEDLIQKAVGWMLREVGKRELAAEENFLLENYRTMPRVMLRYAIERFPEERRRQYLRGEV